MRMELPPEFIRRVQEQLGEEAQAFLEAHHFTVPISILNNPKKPASLNHERESQVPWNSFGAYLKERPAFIRDPLYHAGVYYSQEASSMAITQVLAQYPFKQDAVCLDLCAAPGGKSLVILNALAGKGFLVSNEVHRSRANILDENLLKWGHTNHLVTNTDAKILNQLNERFDLILVDAPCSGEGMFRKDEGAIQEWTAGHVQACASRQQGIVDDILPALKEGGILIYSTCAYSPQENVGMDEKLLAQGIEPLPLSMDESWGFQALTSNKNAFQAFLHKVKGEGFYFAAYRKRSTIGERSRHAIFSVEQHTEEMPYVNIPAGFTAHTWKGEVYAIAEEQQELVAELEELRCMKRPGIPLGQWKGKDFIPAQGLALIPGWTEAEKTELNLEEAWAYLRRETPNISGPGRGWTLASYKGHSLGWIKWVNGRMKNHYTKEWRIRSRW
jgi:16S rRNA (cytosine1407-C5)-methyltransferase